MKTTLTSVLDHLPVQHVVGVELPTGRSGAGPHAFHRAHRMAIEGDCPRFAVPVTDEDACLVRELVHDGLKEGQPIQRCAKLPPRLLHDRVELRQQLAPPGLHCETVLVYAPHAISVLGREFPPELLWIRVELQRHADLLQRRRQVGLERLGAAQLKIISRQRLRLLLRCLEQPPARLTIGGDRATEVDERHRAQDAPEDPAAGQHQRQNSDQRSGVARLEEGRLVSELPFIDPLPPVPVIEAARRMRRHERIPLLAGGLRAACRNFNSHSASREKRGSVAGNVTSRRIWV